eukprot:1589181-Pleurochrysis_carterae.AAC.1
MPPLDSARESYVVHSCPFRGPSLRIRCRLGLRALEGVGALRVLLHSPTYPESVSGKLHHVVVLHQGHVEGGARPPRLQEDRLQGDGEEGRRQVEGAGRAQEGWREGEAQREGLRPDRRRGCHYVRTRRREWR